MGMSKPIKPMPMGPLQKEGVVATSIYIVCDTPISFQFASEKPAT